MISYFSFIDCGSGSVGSQVNELNLIRQQLYEVEAQHVKIRGQYEDELARLRSEVHALRQGPPSSGPQHSASGSGSLGLLGISGLPPGAAAPFPDPYVAREHDRERDLQRQRERGLDRERLDSRDRDRDQRDRERDRERDTRERDRTTDQRDPKRFKSDRIKGDRTGKPLLHSLLNRSCHVWFIDLFSPSLSSGSMPKLPPPGNASASASTLPPPHHPQHAPYASSGPAATSPLTEQGPSAAGALVPISGPPGGGFPDDLDPHNVPPELKKEGSDWFAIFNPKVKRVLDVSLVHTLMHERCTLSSL